MNMPPNGVARPLRAALASTLKRGDRFLCGRTERVSLRQLLRGTTLSCPAAELAGRSVLLATGDQLSTAAALIELDGIARRLILSTPDLAAEHLRGVIVRGEVNVIIRDDDRSCASEGPGVVCDVRTLRPSPVASSTRCNTEWVLLTSGTTGAPKLVVHTFDSLSAPVTTSPTPDDDAVWGTFYDIRRYGGLQILLRALVGGGSLVMADSHEAVGDALRRLAEHRATHVSGTPSHWRRALMSPHARAIAPRYIRLSGEIVDQAILNTLHSTYPRARIGHAFASTEAGVAFEVNDGLEGFPVTVLCDSREVEVRVTDGSLRVRSHRCAARYLGDGTRVADGDGFVDTGDIVERRGDRYFFLGRRSGVINVGGLKVYPEEVEAAINRHPAVRMSMVHSQKNPITGALVAADIVLGADPASRDAAGDVRHQILQLCRERLPRHKIPSTIRFVPAVDIASAGKLVRHG